MFTPFKSPKYSQHSEYKNYDAKHSHREICSICGFTYGAHFGTNCPPKEYRDKLIKNGITPYPFIKKVIN